MIKDLTLYDIMGEDMSILVKVIDTKHINIEVIDERDVTVYAEKSHIYAWDSLVEFAKKVLNHDKKIQEEIMLLEVEDEYYRGMGKK